MNEQGLYQVARVSAAPEQLQGNMFILTPDGAPVTLHWDDLDIEKLPRYVHIRIMTARDDNEEKWVEAFWPTTGESLRAFDVRYARQFQLFAITVERHDAERIAHEGLSLRLDDGTTPLYLFRETQRPFTFSPHMVNVSSRTPLEEFYSRIIWSPVSNQISDWTEGTVLAGVRDLTDIGVLDKSKQPGFSFTLPPKLLPLSLVEDSVIHSHLEEQGWKIQELGQTVLTPQSAYLHAYPLAVLARTLNRPELADRTLAILHEVSQQKLGSWSRDVGLYLLGLVRTLLELPTVDEDLRAEVARLCAWVIGYQSKPGLWATYVDDLKTPPDTMGTAAIATALALAYTRKLIPTRYTTEVNAAVQVLKQFLTPDGFLTGAAPLYEDEALQRSDYRVISQVGMGFFAQLLATSKIFRA